MRKEDINVMLKAGLLRIRQVDKEKIKSLIDSAEINVKVAKNVPLDDKSATLIFREIYESIRQLGEAKWWFEGYEPQGIGSHGVSLDILKEFNIKEKIKFNHFERFKKIRHDANYQGIRVLISQAEEIIDFWNTCGIEIMEILKKHVK